MREEGRPVQLQLLSVSVARPFLKWAGGKGQLLEQMTEFFPEQLGNGAIRRYVEPFIGGGAVFFHIAQHYDIEELVISDMSSELILAYRTVQKDVEGLIGLLEEMQRSYLPLADEARKVLFYETRSAFNARRPLIDFSKYDYRWIERTAQLIFLNRTCFNGLFRVNSKGDFNVPVGRYKKPKICDRDNLIAVHRTLQRTHIHHGDFTSCEQFADNSSFVYFDPPYRPISRTASFTSYARDAFDDSEQLRLADFYRLLDGKGAKLMLSNSDPKNIDPDDNFFEDAYSGFRIERVKASRNINSKARRRGAINELLIMNY